MPHDPQRRYAQDDEINTRLEQQHYEVHKEMEKENMCRERCMEKRRIEQETDLYIKRHYSPNKDPQDTKYPLYKKEVIGGKVISIMINPLDEDKWGRDSRFFWMNKEGLNNQSFQELVHINLN